MNSAKMRDWLTDRDKLARIIAGGRAELGLADPDDEQIWTVCETILSTAIDHIHNRSESPIETIFMTSLTMSIWRFSGGFAPLLPVVGVSQKIKEGGPLGDFLELVYVDLRVGDLPHFATQASIGPYRADAMLFLPSDPSKRLIVECDGYEWHKGNFTSDRQRDRYFQAHGWEVFRFSGSEIWHNPTGTANELFEHIRAKWCLDEWAADHLEAV